MILINIYSLPTPCQIWTAPRRTGIETLSHFELHFMTSSIHRALPLLELYQHLTWIRRDHIRPPLFLLTFNCRSTSNRSLTNISKKWERKKRTAQSAISIETAAKASPSALPYWSRLSSLLIHNSL